MSRENDHRVNPDIFNRCLLMGAEMFAQTDMGMLFGKASGRTIKRFGTIIPFRNGNSLKVKPSNTNPFVIKSPSEALEGSIPMAVFCSRCVKLK